MNFTRSLCVDVEYLPAYVQIEMDTNAPDSDLTASIVRAGSTDTPCALTIQSTVKGRKEVKLPTSIRRPGVYDLSVYDCCVLCSTMQVRVKTTCKITGATVQQPEPKAKIK